MRVKDQNETKSKGPKATTFIAQKSHLWQKNFFINPKVNHFRKMGFPKEPSTRKKVMGERGRFPRDTDRKGQWNLGIWEVSPLSMRGQRGEWGRGRGKKPNKREITS